MGLKQKLPVFFLVALLILAIAAQSTQALSPVQIRVSCPEGTQVTREMPAYPFFGAEVDLLAGLNRNIRAIRICKASGFPSYRDFTDAELERIAALMRTPGYQTRKATSTLGSLALWVEQKLTGNVDARLRYELELRDFYEAIARSDEDAIGSGTAPHFKAMFEFVRSEHTRLTPGPMEQAQVQAQLAFLSHKAGIGLESMWFDAALKAFHRLPAPMDPRAPGLSRDAQHERQLAMFRYKALQRSLDGLKLCFDATRVLAGTLCEVKLKPQDAVPTAGGIEALASWALRGPTPPDSTEEEDRLRAQLKRLERSTLQDAARWRAKVETKLAKGPEYFRSRARHMHEKMQAIQRERDRNPLFRTYFDRLFLKEIKRSTHRYAKGSYYYCDLFDLINPFTKGQCHLDGTLTWEAAHERFPDLMAELREERRQEVLQYAAFYLLKGEQDHPSVRWARQQDDFDQAIEAYRKKKKNRK